MRTEIILNRNIYNVPCIQILRTVNWGDFGHMPKISFLLPAVSSINSLYIYTSALRACLRCAAGGHFVSAGGSLRSPGITLVNYKGDNISKYVCSTVLIDITRKITKFVNFKIFDA